MLKTQTTRTSEIAVDIFGVYTRPCRIGQETIYDYHMDGRPQFEWERWRQLLLFNGNTQILHYCEACPLNVFGGLEGCKGKVENLDIFFRAMQELLPDSPWCTVPRDGSPLHPHLAAQLSVDFGELRNKLSQQTWPVAIPRQDGQPYFDEVDTPEYDEDDPEEESLAHAQGGIFQFYAWNGEGPPGLLNYNEGYSVYLSRHGLLVKPTGEDPIPHTFSRLWREGRGMFGLSSNGDTVGFQMSFARLPNWGYETGAGAELVVERLPADQVFRETLDILEVFCGLALDFETGFLIKQEV